MICILINFNSRKQVIMMKVILMNQNIKVLLAEMDESKWFKGRGIPTHIRAYKL